MFITKHKPLIAGILIDVSDISRLSSHSSLRKFAVKFIATMGFVGANQGLQLNTVVPQRLMQTRIDQLYKQPVLKILNTPLNPL